MSLRPTRRTIELVNVLAALLGLAACDGSPLDRLRDEPPTAYDRYARSLTDAGLATSAMGRDWLVASDSALRAPLVVTLPFREAGYYGRTEARAVAYRFELRDGQRVTVRLRAEGLPARLFMDLYEETSDTAERFVHRATADSGSAVDSTAAANLDLRHEVGRTGAYLLRLQPELLRSGRYDLTITIEPMLAFPVQGGNNRAVQSYFGADRDAGRRRHHGIDIFAPRGTPVLAATDGVVRSTSPNNLGGNVVWLSDVKRRQSLYYAHLDRHHVVEGQRVAAGDTVGFVGNSGNARGTRPHLHFGIYRRGEGPVDPYHHVRLVTERPPPIAADTSRLGTLGRITSGAVPLLLAPRGGADTVLTLRRSTAVQIVGAAGRWYRVQTADGLAGYLASRAVGEVERPLRTASLDSLVSAEAIGRRAAGGQ